MAHNVEDIFDISPVGYKTITSSGSLSNADPSSPKLSASLPTSSMFSSFKGSPSDKTNDSGRGFMDGLESSLNFLETDSAKRLSERKSKRGRKPGQRSISFSVNDNFDSTKSGTKSKLERSRQSARECRARKKIRYQYLDDLILEREKVNSRLREELLLYQGWCHSLDQGEIPEGLSEALKDLSLPNWNPS